MKTILSKVLIFTAGAAVGAGVTWKVLEAKYREQARQEANEIREYYCGKYGEPAVDSEEVIEESEDEADPSNNPDLKEYMGMVLDQGYTNYAKGGVREERPKKEEEVEDVERPYVIPPEEFGETGYKTVSLTYYADEVLADCRNKVVKNVDDVVGVDSLTTFGKYEEDSVFVRNDAKKTDYEILLDPKAYSEIINTTAHSAEDE